MENYKHVMVYIEQRDHNIQGVSLELLGEGRKLAEKLDCKVKAILIGKDVSSLADEVGYYGADEVILVEDDRLEKYNVLPYAKALAEVSEELKPEIILIGATSIGRDLAPRVSARLQTGLTADCTILEIDEETKLLMMTRPAFGGNLMATILCKDHRPQMSTVRPGVMQKNERDESRKAEVTKMDIEFTNEDFVIEILEENVNENKMVQIEESKRLISCGRGMGSAENLHEVDKLKELLKAEVSCSRAVVDSNWLEKERQVGQTGKTVRPDLYMALGISGAIQHIAGMENAEFIIAVNNNASAPIFQVADLGIVADVHQLIPELTTLLEERSKKA